VHPDPAGVTEFDTRHKDQLANLIGSRKQASTNWGQGVMPIIIVAMPDNRWIYRLFYSFKIIFSFRSHVNFSKL